MVVFEESTNTYHLAQRAYSIKDLEMNNDKFETIVFDTEKTEVEKEKEKNKETDNSDLSNKGAYAQMLIKGYRNVKKSFDKKTDKESDKKIEENIKRIKGLL